MAKKALSRSGIIVACAFLICGALGALSVLLNGAGNSKVKPPSVAFTGFEGLAHAEGGQTGQACQNGVMIPSGDLQTTHNIQNGGTYCLGGDTWINGNVGLPAIQVIASGGTGSNMVTIDLNGFTLFCNGNCANYASSAGIDIQTGNVVIRNGRLFNFNRGINGNTANVYNVKIDGLQIYSNGMPYGIYFGNGAQNVVIDNCFITNALSGISINGGPGIFVARNNVVLNSGGTSANAAIKINGAGSSTYVMLLNNSLAYGYYGIYAASASVKYRDTTTYGFTTAYYGGTNIGNNN